jgi:hypothetical protein
MSKQFRENVVEVGNIATEVIRKFLEGEKSELDVVKHAAAAISNGVRISNRNQTDDQIKRSQSLKLLQLIPAEHRSAYIAAMHPETRPFLLDRPKAPENGATEVETQPGPGR